MTQCTFSPLFPDALHTVEKSMFALLFRPFLGCSMNIKKRTKKREMGGAHLSLLPSSTAPRDGLSTLMLCDIRPGTLQAQRGRLLSCPPPCPCLGASENARVEIYHFPIWWPLPRRNNALVPLPFLAAAMVSTVLQYTETGCQSYFFPCSFGMQNGQHREMAAPVSRSY